MRQGLAIAAGLALAAAAAVWFWSTGIAPDGPPFPPGPPPTSGASGAPPSLQIPQRRVVLFFADAGGQGLREEERQVPRALTLPEEARIILAELARGPLGPLQATLPPGLLVRQFFLDALGTAYVDFPGHLREVARRGPGAEVFAVYSIVDTLAINFEEVKRVQILLDGQEIDTLAGHVDTHRPLEPRFAPETLQ